MGVVEISTRPKQPHKRELDATMVSLEQSIKLNMEFSGKKYRMYIIDVKGEIIYTVQ